MSRQIYSSGYCFVLPTESEREFVEGYPDVEFLKLGVERIPAVGDIRYYERFDRYGTPLPKHHFIIERVVSVDIDRTSKCIMSDNENNSIEKVEAILKIVYQVDVHKLINPPLWEQQLNADI